MSMMPESVGNPMGDPGGEELDPEALAQTQEMLMEQQLGKLGKMDEQEIVAMVDEWFERCLDTRRHIERDTLLNIAFLLDQQYVSVSKAGGSVRLTPEAPKKGKVRTTEQIIEPHVRREIARLVRTRPKGQTVPLGQDPEDYEAAQAADDVLQYVQQVHRLEEYDEEAALWMIAGGTAHKSVGWDATAVDEDGNQGDFLFRVLSPFEFGVPQLRKTRLQDQKYVMVTKTYELDEIEDRWNRKVGADKNTKFSSFDDRLTSLLGSGSQSNHSTTAGSKVKDLEMAVVKEVWIKPSPLAPQGAVIVVASGTVLDIHYQWPEWCKGKYPFEKMEYMKVPGSYWGKPMINALIPIQKRHNRAASVVVEQLGMLSTLVLSAPRNTKMRGAMGGKAVIAEVPAGMPGNAAHAINPPQMGDLAFREMDNTRRASADIAHQHEVSRGTTPPNVRSGTAINALKELDDSASAIPIAAIERSTQAIGRFILNIVKETWDEPRFIYVIGEEMEVERHSFLSGEDIGGQYVVAPGSAWPFSRAEREARIYGALERGLIGQEEALRHLEFGVPRKILMERTRDERHARRENQKFKALSPVNPQTGEPDMEFVMAQFQQLMPADWHEHFVHLKLHNDERKSPSYERWPTWKKALFESHIAGHMAAIRMQMEAAAGQGQPPGEQAPLPMPEPPMTSEEGPASEGEPLE